MNSTELYLNDTYKYIMTLSKNAIPLVLSLLVFANCNSSSQESTDQNSSQLAQLTSLINLDEFEPRGELIKEISFETITHDPFEIEIFEDSIIPWISIENPAPLLDSLVAKDEIVLNQTNVILVIDYPLESPIEIDLTSDSNEGFSRKELITKISIEYHRIYSEEEESSTVEVTPMEEREIMNRNTTNGKYGIWGHDLADLDLSLIQVHQDGDDILLYLYVES